jgi:hypothetical protein
MTWSVGGGGVHAGETAHTQFEFSTKTVRMPFLLCRSEPRLIIFCCTDLETVEAMESNHAWTIYEPQFPVIMLLSALSNVQGYFQQNSHSV